MKIGIYAGTFDPVHLGHLAFAEAAIRQAALDRVVIVAEHEPYRKKPHAHWDHRQAMIERATEHMPQIDHDYQFASALARQHTMQDMLLQAEKHYGKEHQYWFLVGSDTFEHMHKWHDVVSHEDYGGFVVALREDHSETWLQEHLDRLRQNDRPLQAAIITSRYPGLSSGVIRQSLPASQVEGLPDAVASYIEQHHLYN